MIPEGTRRIAEERSPGDLPVWTHPEWCERFPWLVQGTTSAGVADAPFDLGLFGEQPVGAVLSRWTRLRTHLRIRALVHSHQVHETHVLTHASSPAEGLLVVERYDGHVTNSPELVLTVSVADCVPVSMVEPESRSVAIVHAGWRGVAGGIVENAIESLQSLTGRGPEALWLHCGPAICGECYEVGPEVHQAIYPQAEGPNAPRPIDLRAAIAERVAAAGVRAERVTLSEHCTLCSDAGFFSHRGGERGRQMGFIGVRGTNE